MHHKPSTDGPKILNIILRFHVESKQLELTVDNQISDVMFFSLITDAMSIRLRQINEKAASKILVPDSPMPRIVQ